MTIDQDFARLPNAAEAEAYINEELPDDGGVAKAACVYLNASSLEARNRGEFYLRRWWSAQRRAVRRLISEAEGEGVPAEGNLASWDIDWKVFSAKLRGLRGD